MYLRVFMVSDVGQMNIMAIRFLLNEIIFCSSIDIYTPSTEFSHDISDKITTSPVLSIFSISFLNQLWEDSRSIAE